MRAPMLGRELTLPSSKWQRQRVGVDVSLVELDMSDTATSGNSGSVSASRLTLMAGNSIRGAAEAL